MVVVDCLYRYPHFCALPHPFMISTIAQVFMDYIFRLHDMPDYIVTDCDPTFTYKLWQGLFKQSRAYHPQTIGQT